MDDSNSPDNILFEQKNETEEIVIYKNGGMFIRSPRLDYMVSSLTGVYAITSMINKRFQSAVTLERLVSQIKLDASSYTLHMPGVPPHDDATDERDCTYCRDEEARQKYASKLLAEIDLNEVLLEDPDLFQLARDLTDLRNKMDKYLGFATEDFQNLSKAINVCYMFGTSRD